MDKQGELGVGYRYFQDMWEQPRPSPALASQAMWDECADEWARRFACESAYKAQMLGRVAATAGFLRQRGLLPAGSTVLDIGCALGLFTVEFAKTAAHATGLDVSPRMVRHAAAYARQQGVKNVSFAACDFRRADLARVGGKAGFDLVMACLMPAVTSVAELEAVMRLSKKHCLHVSFVQSRDSLEERVARDLYGGPPAGGNHWDGRVFYAVLNLLFLDGYNPETFYYRQTVREKPEPDCALAERYADAFRFTGAAREAEAGRILQHLLALREKEGALRRDVRQCFGFLLWDVTEKSGPRVFEDIKKVPCHAGREP